MIYPIIIIFHSSNFLNSVKSFIFIFVFRFLFQYHIDDGFHVVDVDNVVAVHVGSLLVEGRRLRVEDVADGGGHVEDVNLAVAVGVALRGVSGWQWNDTFAVVVPTIVCFIGL